MIITRFSHVLNLNKRLVNFKLTKTYFYKNSVLEMSKQAAVTKSKILVTRSDIPAAGMTLLQDRCELIVWDSPLAIPRSELLSKVVGVNGIFCTLTDKIDEEVLKAAGPELKVVATMSVGVDHLDLKALKARNIPIGYTPGVLTNATAELTMALLLATMRRLIEANRAIYKGEWKTWGVTWMCGPKLAGSTVGIVGLGRIGLRVAECLQGFKISRLLYWSRREKKEATEFGGKKVDLDELLKESDFVIVLIALTPETTKMFDKETFEKMKRTAIFINSSRGEVVDQAALISALKAGTIRAAGLDVMTPEPIPLNSELLQLDNCVVLPHIGSANTETREEMAKITAENILAVLDNSAMPARLQI